MINQNRVVDEFIKYVKISSPTKSEGKFADFIILDKDIMKVGVEDIPNTKVVSTFLYGKMVYNNSSLAK